MQASAKLEAKQQSREENLVKQCQRSKQAKTSQNEGIVFQPASKWQLLFQAGSQSNTKDSFITKVFILFPGLHQTVRIVPFAVISIFERSQTTIFVLGQTKALDVSLFLPQFSYFKSPSCETIQLRIDILLFSFPRC